MISSKQHKRKRILDLIASHEQWIKSNSYDSEGVKERREWIEECQQELKQLETTANV